VSLSRRVGLAVVFAAVLAPAGAGAEQRALPLYIQADRLFDGRTMVRGRVAVAVRRGRIVAAGRLSIPRGARVLRFRGGTILPGFIDLHVHSTTPSMLRAGVTTTRNLGEPEAVLRPPHALPRYPRMFSSGPLITVPGGYPTRSNPGLAAPVRSAEEAERKVDALVAKGAAVIKISLETFDGRVPTLDAGQVRAIVARAHRHGRRATAHVADGRGLRIALDGGVDELAHMPCTGVSPDQLEALAARGIEVVGTLRGGRLFRPQCHDSLTNARAFVAAGGRLLYGTDIPAVPATLDLVELGLLRQASLSSQQTLAAGTSEAGRALGRPRFGTLTRGAPADLWVVAGDPTRSLRALGRPRFVMARGGRVR
jgi:imidazolonepropionase-like amidohydrolase